MTYVSQCVDNKVAETHAGPNGVLKSRPSDCVSPREQPLRQDGFDSSSKEEGRVRGASQAEDCSAESCVGRHDGGEASSSLSDDQACGNEAFAGQLEEVQQSSIAGTVHDGGAAGIWRKHLKDSSSLLGQGSSDCGAEQLCRGDQGGDGGEGEGGSIDPHVPEVRDSYDSKDQQDDRPEVLGVHGLPSLHLHPEPSVRRSGCSRSSTSPGWISKTTGWISDKAAALGIRRGNEWGDDQACPAGASASGIIGKLGHVVSCVNRRVAEGNSRISDIAQAGTYAGGSEDDQGVAKSQGGAEVRGGEEVSDEPTWTASPEPERAVRDKIRKGQVRRRQAKRGTWKRLTGNCTQLAGALCFLTLSVFSACGNVFMTSVYGDTRPDVIEIFGGAAEVSLQFAQRGWNVIQPIDIIHGVDLKDSAVREDICKLIDDKKPRLVIVEYPCRLWGKWTDVNYNTPQRKRLLNKLRNAERPFLEFCEKVFDMQLARGDQALAENPLGSHSFKEPPMRRVLERPDVMVAVSHACQFNFRHVDSGKLLKKPTMWICTSQEMCDQLSRRCPNRPGHEVHAHGWCEGRKVTQHAGKYTKELARCIHKGFLNTLKRTEPSRIESLLKAVKKRIGKPNRDGLVWTDEKLDKIGVKQVFVQDGDNPPDGESMDVYEPGDVLQNGITFEIPPGSKLDAGAKAVLRRLHCNLGHPGTKDLQRFLRHADAPQHMIEAVSWIRCGSCAQSQRPRTYRTTRMPPHDLQFNDQIMIDCFHMKDAKRKGHWFMSMLDRSTMYHLVTMIPDHSPETFCRVFFQDWVKWAGRPIEVSIDLERGFGSQLFSETLGEAGISVVPIAGQAHWQHGKIERHGAIIKDMLGKVITEQDIKTPEELSWAANEVSMAKNTLIREHGFSPAQLLFGRKPKPFGEIEENGETCCYHFSVGEKGSQLAKRMKYRTHAKQAFVNAQAQEMLSRTARNRTRPWSEPQIGDKCFFYREVRKKGVPGLQKRWLGPALVVGIQGQSNVWVVFGGKCFLVAQEHTRQAVGEESMIGRPEVQEALAIFKGLINKDGGGDYEDITEQDAPMDHVLDNVGDNIMDSDEELIPAADHPGNPNRMCDLPEHLKPLCEIPGWKEDVFGNPVNVAFKGYGFRVLPSRVDVRRFPYRSSWGFWRGKWRLLEDEVLWGRLEDSCDVIPGGPADLLVTVFKPGTRKQECLDCVPESFKKRYKYDHDVFLSLSQRKAQKALDKEIPYEKILEKDREDFKVAERKEWQSWLDYDAVEVLSIEESQKVLADKRERILKSRYVFRNKNAGLVDEKGAPLPLKAKARLCVAGQNCPDCMSGEVRVDAPTIQHASLTTFLHLVVSLGWVENWRCGDISSAFLQGEESKGEPLFMFPPSIGLPDVSRDQILRLKRPVYGRPDAPRAWYEQISSFIMGKMNFERSILDPAMFIHRKESGEPDGLLVLHVDDLMVATDGNSEIEKKVKLLCDRFPFGEWEKVSDSVSGINYCGKEIVVEHEHGEKIIFMRQRGFVDGRLELVPLDNLRKKQLDEPVTEEERSDFRSVVGALQWLTTQTRPDLAFPVNQLQKRINKLTVRDLLEANKAVRVAKQNELGLKFRNLGKGVAVVTWHDAGLFNSVGVEIDEADVDYIHELGEKKMLYSQKGAVTGFVKREDLDRTDGVSCNFTAWRSKTNRRIVESSFAAETHGAIMGFGQGQYQRMLLLEIMHGSWIVQRDDLDLDRLTPLVLCTDCKSVYDCIRKDAQSVSDKSNAINIAILRQICTAERNPKSEKARMLWVPTRHQNADALTKGGLHGTMQAVFGKGEAVFHAVSAKALQSKEICTSVRN